MFESVHPFGFWKKKSGERAKGNAAFQPPSMKYVDCELCARFFLFFALRLSAPFFLDPDEDLGSISRI